MALAIQKIFAVGEQAGLCQCRDESEVVRIPDKGQVRCSWWQ